MRLKPLIAEKSKMKGSESRDKVYSTRIMYNTNITTARANLYKLVDMTIEDGEIININTKKGNAVIMSEADYNSIMETLYLSSNPDVKKSIIDGINTPLEECVAEEQVKW